MQEVHAEMKTLPECFVRPAKNELETGADPELDESGNAAALPPVSTCRSCTKVL
jgi:hypothetical protein